eukprot:TRINITY_DN9211_c1_g1_i1.p1 TRINITY_DN9211_c1_g1~~TRINITY_DN9211_c1_g1_i1.p1  ORF type:complete len:190 (+),score=12.81 TRINITY_DN9211_c1_g1_i1:1101-1670(+)
MHVLCWTVCRCMRDEIILFWTTVAYRFTLNHQADIVLMCAAERLIQVLQVQGLALLCIQGLASLCINNYALLERGKRLGMQTYTGEKESKREKKIRFNPLKMGHSEDRTRDLSHPTRKFRLESLQKGGFRSTPFCHISMESLCTQHRICTNPWKISAPNTGFAQIHGKLHFKKIKIKKNKKESCCTNTP